MKALTLYEPYAMLVALGLKTIETRGWRTWHRGPLVIHAAKAFPRWARVFAASNVCRDALASRGVSVVDLPFGAIVATTDLDDCKLIVPAADATTPHLMRPPEPPELLFGDYSEGRYGFVLARTLLLPTPIPAVGHQGLWEWDGGIAL